MTGTFYLPNVNIELFRITMWHFSNSQLPKSISSTSTAGAPLAFLGEGKGAPFFVVNYRANITNPQISTGTVAVEFLAEVPTPVGNIYTVEVGKFTSSPLAFVTMIVANNVAYSPAKDASNPQAGEFVFDPYTQQIRLVALTSSP